MSSSGTAFQLFMVAEIHIERSQKRQLVLNLCTTGGISYPTEAHGPRHCK